MHPRSTPLLLLCLLCCHPHGAPPPEQAAWLADPLPGAQQMDPALRQRLQAAWDRRPLPYHPRTGHLRPDGTPRYTNRLLLEASPYLRQHAHNPVNFFPFGEEAFALARASGRPVFLSIGYSTCHWCHVMEEESFDDEEIARYLNQSYVAIKVDREERPDLDAFYLSALEALTGSGGWPMSLWLTPDRRPFYGATYIPPRDGDRGARMGFLTQLRRLRELYDSQRAQVDTTAARLQAAAQQALGAGSAPAAPAGEARSAAAIDPAGLARVRDLALRLYKERFDPQNGGLLGQRKFPSSLPVRLLLRAHRRTGDRQALDMATLTLERMAAGGIHDQLGGGFHRYATDPQWLVPHFEKMLYDNALLVQCYLDGYQVTGRQDFAEVARRTLRYAAREMTAPEGGFYAATDADSPGPDGHRREGLFFTWTPAEIEGLLGPRRGHLLEEFYGVTAAGHLEGRSVLHLAAPTSPTAALLADRDLLYAARASRPPPLRDEKILASWNGLMISAMARGAWVLDEPDLAAAAERAAAFILSHLRDHGTGPLSRSFVAGRAGGPGFLDDHAFLIAGLLDLYEATGAPRWLREALALEEVLAASFEDREGGGFFLAGSTADPLGRHKPATDGAEPSGNSVQLMNLLRLGSLTSQDRFRQQAERLLSALSGGLASSPTGLGELLLGVEFLLGRPQEIVLVTAGPLSQAEPLLAVLRRTYHPDHVLVRASRAEDLGELERLLPLLRGKVPLKGQPTAYVCERGACQLPTVQPAVFSTLLHR